MANMTIENIGRFIENGNLEQVIDGGRAVANPSAPEIPGQAPEGAKAFTSYLAESIEKANDIQRQADAAARELIAGRNKNIHETMLMLEKADMSFRLMMQVRNKVIDAYREIMRMQV